MGIHNPHQPNRAVKSTEQTGMLLTHPPKSHHQNFDRTIIDRIQLKELEINR
jgi:hypothetical protein